MLPGMDGFEVLKRIRAESAVNVLLLTARGEDVDRIVGLEIGADDYVPKPFNPRELLARMRAVLRRTASPSQAQAETLLVDDLELDAAARKALRADRNLDLTDIEFGLLEALMRSAGKVVNREELSQSVLGRQFDPFDRSLDMHVSRLRRKLSDAGAPADQVKTIRGVGYQLAIQLDRTGAED
jgi:two-component system response regulator CpxR